MNRRPLALLLAFAVALAAQPAQAAWLKKRKPAPVEPEPIEAKDLDKLLVFGLRFEPQLDYEPVLRAVTAPRPMQPLEGEFSLDGLTLLAPSIYAIESGGQPQQLNVRGLSYGMNQATLDGVSIATVGNGSGERGAFTGVLPTQIGVRTSVDRSFSAESDGAVVGGLIDVATRSAFGRNKPWTQLHGWVGYDTYKDAALGNAGDQASAHWGGGFKAGHARRFGAQEEFGVVLSYTAQQDANNGARRWQDRKGYFSQSGGNLGEPDLDRGWNGIATPLNFGYGSYPGFGRSRAAAAKLEWQPADSYARAALLWFGKRQESQSNETSNALYVAETASGIVRQDAAGGSLRVRSVDSIWAGTATRRDNQGLVATLDNDFGQSQLSLRGGYSFEEFRSVTDRFQVRADDLLERDIVVGYDAGGLPRVVGVDVAGAADGDAFSGLPYVLIDGNATRPRVRATLGNLRANYAWNARGDDRGFGFVAGAQWRRSTLRRDVQRTVYATGQDMAPWLFDPGAASWEGQQYRVPWLDGRALRDAAAAALAVNANATLLQSVSGDFGYDETVQAGFFSAHYATERTLCLLGLRHDRVGFDARTAAIQNGEVADAAVDFSGGYSHWLPSFNLRHYWDEDTQLRVSVSRTLARPNPSAIAAAQSISCSTGTETDGEERCILTRGNPDLQPQRAENFDIDVQRQFKPLKLTASLGWFHKTVRDNIFTLTGSREIDGVEYSVRQPMNLEDMTVKGVEMALRRSELEIGGQVFDSSLNASWIRGQTAYISDAGTRRIEQLVGQPTWMANFGLAWRLPAIRGSLNLGVSARSAVVTGLGALKPWEDGSREGFATASLSLSQRIGRNLSLRYEASNITDEQPRYLKGDAYRYPRQSDDYGRAFALNVVWEGG